MTADDTNDGEPKTLDAISSDGKLVLKYLVLHGPSVRQQALQEEYEWTRSKTSDLLQQMEEKGHVARLKYKQQRIIYLPQYAPYELRE